MTTSPERSLLLTLFLVGLSACSADGPSATHSVRDSAGIRIVETHRFAWEDGNGWALSPDPVLEIGTRDGEAPFQFYQIAGGLRLPDGRVVVLNSGSKTVRVFSDDGRFLTEFGGSGDGPGEFRGLGSVHRLSGDTLLIWENGRPGFSLFTLTGEFVRAQRLSAPGSERLSTVHPLPNDRLAVMTYSSHLTHGEPTGPGIHRDLAPMLLYSTHGTLLDTIGFFPSAEIMIIEFGGGSGTGPPPFQKTTHAGVDRGQIFVGTAEGMRISALDSSGELDASFRYPGADLTVREEDRAWYSDRMMEMASTPQEQQMLPDLLAALTFPETRASYSDLKVDETGAIWLRTGRHFPPYGASPEWTILSPEGVFLGRISLPDRFEPFHFGADYVIGSWRDEMDVEYVRAYALRK